MQDKSSVRFEGSTLHIMNPIYEKFTTTEKEPGMLGMAFNLGKGSGSTVKWVDDGIVVRHGSSIVWITKDFIRADLTWTLGKKINKITINGKVAYERGHPICEILFKSLVIGMVLGIIGLGIDAGGSFLSDITIETPQ